MDADTADPLVTGRPLPRAVGKVSKVKAVSYVRTRWLLVASRVVFAFFYGLYASRNYTDLVRELPCDFLQQRLARPERREVGNGPPSRIRDAPGDQPLTSKQCGGDVGGLINA